MNRDLKAIVRLIEGNGYTVVRGGKHLKVKNADGNTVATLPSTPSGHIWRTRLMNDLQKTGIV